MSEDQFRQLREDIAALRTETNGRLSAIEARLESKADKGDVFRSIFLVNGSFIAIIGIIATTLRTFGAI